MNDERIQIQFTNRFFLYATYNLQIGCFHILQTLMRLATLLRG